MSLGGPLHRLLAHARQMYPLVSPAQVLRATCAEGLALAGASRAFGTFSRSGRPWEHGVFVVVDGGESSTARVSRAAQSALFAVHRRLAAHPGPLVLARSDAHAAVFRGLAAGLATDAARVLALPLRSSAGRLMGELAFVASTSDGFGDAAPVLFGELATSASAALELAQRVAVAKRDQDRMLLLAEATDEALWDWSLDTGEFWWGGSIQQLLGAAEHAPPDASWRFRRIHPDDAARVERSFEHARRSLESSWREQYRFRRADGTWIHVEDRAYFLREVDGRAYRATGALRDISALKDLFVREQRARAEAERANRAKDEFLAMLGHELRNPLAPIVTALQLMRMRDVPQIQRELTVVERQAAHLTRLVDDLLDVARIASGKIELKRQRVAVEEAITRAIEMAQPLVKQRRHALEVQIGPDLFVHGDPARLAQVVSNLLNNAAKFTEPGGRIRVVAARVAAAVEIHVVDDGVGIAPETLPYVFEMFAQERQDIARSQGGLGLGLSIVRSLVRLHGGTVAAHSDGPGRGTTMTIALPAVEATAEDGAETAQGRHVLARLARRRILVVDDNADAARLMAELLASSGAVTRVAYDGAAALAVAEDFEPELALLDLGLPVMDGYELAKRLRARSSRPLRLVAVTGYGQDDDRRRALDAGFDEHLVKPITVDVLVRALWHAEAPRGVHTEAGDVVA